MTDAYLAGAAPAHLWPALAPGTTVSVLGSAPAACFLELAGTHADAGTVVALLAGGASLLPFGIRTGVAASRAPWRHLGPGTEGTVDGPVLRLPGLEVSIGRWWRAAAVGGPTSRRALVAGRLGQGLAELRAALAAHPDAPELPAYGGPKNPGAEALLGLGPGLTPYGDDVLAGRLLAAAAWGSRRDLAALSDEVLAAAPGRTSPVSLACLREAAAGRCVPEAARVVDAVSGFRRGPAAVDDALTALLHVGHTSGHGLAVGLRDGAGAALAGRAACA